MGKKFKRNFGKLKENTELQDINELMEMGLKKEEISRELGISQKYIKKVFKDYYRDY